MMYLEVIERTRSKLLNIDCVRVKVERVVYNVMNIMIEIMIMLSDKIINY